MLSSDSRNAGCQGWTARVENATANESVITKTLPANIKLLNSDLATNLIFLCISLKPISFIDIFSRLANTRIPY